MQKKYKISLLIIGIEYLILYFWNKMGWWRIQTWIGNAIGTLIFLLPILGLLFMLGRDQAITPQKRMWCKVLFYFFIVCYIAGGIATFLEL